MKRKYVIRRFLFGLLAILIAGSLVWIDYLVLIDRLSVGFLWVTLPAILLLGRISKDMDILSVVIELTKEMEKDEKEDEV